MKTFKVTFPFRGHYHFVEFTSDMIANDIMCGNDEVYSDIVYDEDNKSKEYFEAEIYEGGERFIVGFGCFGNSKVFNVYEYEEDGGGTVVEKDIPWCLLKVTDEDDKTIYDICDEL